MSLREPGRKGPRKFRLGGVACSSHTIGELLEEVRQLLADKTIQPRTILCVNAHIHNLAWHDPELRRYLDEARIVTADGMSMVWAARWLGEHVAERCNQTEAYHAFLAEEQMPPSRAVLIGCSQAEADAAVARARGRSRHCQVLQGYSGYLSDAGYERVLTQGPEVDIIFLGMGTPRTEQVAQVAARVCPRAIVWGIGGGTVRIEAGSMFEAPPAWRRAGLQWLHRLATSPGSMWRRYLIGLPVFSMHLARTKLRRPRGR
jgi:N-acetylglucosaminyldiphosphoundecaprenol N-acetyl-beta-D-mannosaminyltransferase